MTWGNICGLRSTDLSVDLLKKLEFEKLLECLDYDPRVQHIISARLLDQTTQSVRYFSKIPKEIILKYPNIISIYNRFLEKNRKEIDKPYFYYRSNLVLWHMLDDHNKKKELENWINKKESIIRESTIDYTWLYNKYPTIAEDLRKKVWAEKDRGSYYQSGLKNMIRNIPKSHANEFMDEVFKLSSKTLKLQALSNPYLQDKYIIKALKIAAKRTHIPTVKVTIKKEIIEKLPTVTRLEILEKFVANKVDIVGVDSTEKFKELLFGAVMRHPGRVENIVKRFEYIRRSKLNE